MMLGIVGLIGAGKGAIGDYLKTRGFLQESFAKPLKDAVAIIFNWDREMLEGSTPESRAWREEVDQYWSKKLNRVITPRLALQWMGTEAGRNVFGFPLWTASLQNRIVPTKDYVITDCRFENEIQAIKESGGSIIKIMRGQDPIWVPSARVAKFEGLDKIPNYPDIHISEWDWINCQTDYVIENNSTLEKLHENVSYAVTYLR